MGFITALWEFLLASAPYLLLGIFVSGLIHAFLNSNTIKRLLGGQGVKQIFFASLFGVPLPLCSCSVIPTAVTLRKSGASNAATSSFLISTPESGVDSIMVTYALMDFPMTVLRPLSAFVTAIVAGFMQVILKNDFEPEQEEQKKSCCSHNKDDHIVQHRTESLVQRFISGLKYAFGKLIDDLSLWLSIGMILGALVSYLVPSDFFSNVGLLQSRLLILAIGIPVYICASATTPLAAALIMKGLTPGAALLLLLVGPATNLSNIAVLQKYIGKKGVMINVASIAIVALIFSFVTDWLYLDVWKVDFAHHMKMNGHDHAEHYGLLNTISAVVLVVLLIKGILREEILPRLKGEGHHAHHH